MKKEIIKAVKRVDMTLMILVALVLIAGGLAWWKGGWELTKSGLMQAGNSVETVWLRLLLGITLSGMIQLLIPRAAISKLLGPTSGIRGILIGSYSAIIMSGPPYVMIPVVSSIYAAGAGVGPVIALLTGEALLGLQHLIAWQIPFLGVGLPLSKYAICLFITPLVGLAGAVVFKLLTRLPDIPAKSDRSVFKIGRLDEGEKVGAAAKGEKLEN